MQYISSVERIGMRKGLEQGLEKGLEQGLEQGLEKGLEQGLREGIAIALEAKFGADGAKLMRKTRVLDVAGLRQFARFLKKPHTFEDVRDYLS